MATSKSKIEKQPERDFVKEYNEIMRIVGRNMNDIETEWNQSGFRIKKFSLFEKTPPPIVTNNTHPINY